MPNPREETRGELLARGLPTDYVQRLVVELAEHWEDAVREQVDAGVERAGAEIEANQRLGTPAALATDAARAFRRRLLLGRHPLLSLVLLPTLGFPLLWAAFLLVSIGGGAWLLEFLGVSEQSRLMAVLLRGACNAASYWVGTGLVIGIYWAGRRTVMGNPRTWAACGLVAIAASFNHIAVMIPSARMPTGSLAVGISPIPGLIKFLLPLAAVLLMEVRWRRSNVPIN